MNMGWVYSLNHRFSSSHITCPDLWQNSKSLVGMSNHNVVGTHPYAHPQHIKVVKHLIYIQADRACGFSSQGQTDLCFFNSWTGRQSKLTIVLFLLFRKFVRTQSHKINMYRSARKSDLMDTSNPPQAVGSSTLLHS